jgi:hypothetical protein
MESIAIALGATLLSALALGFSRWLPILRTWSSRTRGRSVKLSLEGDSLELTGTDAEAQAKLIAEWLQRHGDDVRLESTLEPTHSRQPPSQSTPKSRHMRRFHVAAPVVVSTVLGAAALWVVLSERYVDSTQNWAFGALGAIAGFWLRPE